MIDEVVASMDPFEIEVKTAGIFPRWDKPRVVNLDLKGNSISREANLILCLQ
jgi:2'-5' RNA ligase